MLFRAWGWHVFVPSDSGDRISRFALLSSLLLMIVTIAAAQDQSIDSPHISPHAGAKISSLLPAGATIPALTSRPLRVDVNLVLVPVTVVDSHNSPVLNLPR